jgi:localization factor PodJL
MSGQSPWSVKGVEPRTREAAKDLARREGLTLGELLNRLIAETDEPAQKPALSAKSAANFGQEANRLTAALEQLSRRLESGGVELVPPPTTLGVDDRLSQKFEKSMATGDTAMGRIETHLNDLHETQVVLSERLRRIESQDPTHASLAALKSLESALARLATQVFETDSRVGQIEKVTQEAIQTVDQSLGLVAERLATTEALAQETNHRFVEAMIDLSARLTGLEEVGERVGGPDVSVFESRLGQLEDITTQTVEGANQGINQVTERLSSLETHAQDNASRMVEALVDLSARLTQLEGAGKTGDTLTAVEALEAKTTEFSARLNDLNAEIEATRADLQGQVKAALTGGIDGQMTEVAQALASRLDASEQRSQDAYDRVSAKLAEATQALDSRLAQVENRESAPDQTGSMAMKLELARITRGMDERLSSIERHDASVMEQAGQHIQRLAQDLGNRIDATERQAAESIATITKQMQELADRLAANHDKAVQSLASSFNGSDSKTRQMLDEALGQVRAEVQSVDGRVQALIAPLQRDFLALGDRLDKAEQGAVSAYAEPIYDPNHSVDLGGPASGEADFVNPVDLSHEDGFSFESRAGSLEKPQHDDPFFMDRPAAKIAAAPATANPARRGSFGSPFPDAEDSEPLSDFADLRDDVPDPLAGGVDPFGDEPEAMVLDPARPIDDDSDDGLSDLNPDWDEPGSNSSSAPDYLVAARRAANQAAAAREAAQTKKKPALTLKGPAGKDKKAEAAKAKPSAKPQAPQAMKEGKEGGKPKSPLSPVGIAAAAALVATAGFAVYSQLKPSSNVDEKPAALNQENVPLPPELAAQAAMPAPVEGAVPMPGTEVAQAPTTAEGPAPTSATTVSAPPPAAAAPSATAAPVAPSIPSPPPQLPKAQLVPPATKAAVQVPAPPPAKPSPTPQQIEAARVMASADAQARAARARAEAQRDRLRSPTFKAARVDAAPRPVQRPTPPRVATVAKAPASSATTPPRVASVAAPALATTAVAAAPTRVPVSPTDVTSGVPAPSPTRAVPAAASPATPAAGSLFDQATAREQAGDGAGSVALLRRAADGGDTRAMNRLARKFETGDGVTKDLAQARALTERAAARGSRQAMHNLGVYYANGDGVPQNMARAAESFRRAAQRGVTDSQFNLGAMAEQGLGGPKSDVQAYYWFALAARGGDQDASAKVREIGARLTPEQKADQDQLVAKFRPDGGSPD